MSEKADLAKALRKQRAVLAKLEAQAAGFGSLHVPAHILVEIDDAKAKIADLENQIAKLPAIDTPPTTDYDQERLAQLEKEINTARQLLNQTLHDLLTERDPRKKRSLKEYREEIRANLSQMIDDYRKASGDPSKFPI